MNHYKARELREGGHGTGKWHYTCMNNDHIYPVGYCSPWDTCPDCQGHSMFNSEAKCEKCSNKGVIKSENPCMGHDTPEDAESHYKEYIIDKAHFYGPKQQEWPKNKCSVKDCNEEGNCLISADQSHFEVCNKHNTRTVLRELISVRECWSS